MISNTIAMMSAAMAVAATAMMSPQHRTNIEIKTNTMRQIPVVVILNEEKVNFPDQGPMVSGSRVYVPLRGVFEKMDAHLEWKPDERKVVATKNEKMIELWIGKTTAVVAGETVNLDASPKLVNGRTMVPLRFISESLGADVDWIAEERKVVIKADG